MYYIRERVDMARTEERIYNFVVLRDDDNLKSDYGLNMWLRGGSIKQ